MSQLDLEEFVRGVLSVTMELAADREQAIVEVLCEDSSERSERIIQFFLEADDAREN